MGGDTPPSPQGPHPNLSAPRPSALRAVKNLKIYLILRPSLVCRGFQLTPKQMILSACGWSWSYYVCYDDYFAHFGDELRTS